MVTAPDGSRLSLSVCIQEYDERGADRIRSLIFLKSNRLFDAQKSNRLTLKNEFGKVHRFQGVFGLGREEKGQAKYKNTKGLPVFSISLMNSSTRLNR